MQTRRQRAVAAVTATALAAGSAVVLSAVPATAQEATGGEGRFVQQIQWMDFGANGETVPADGFTKTERIDLGGQEVDLTCVIGPQRGGTLKAYRSGEWQGDALDDLYNVGGTGRSNTLVNALANEVDGSTVTFDFSCSATVNGEALPLGGLVIADAEQSRTGEYVAATAPPSATWRIIDRFRDAECDNSNIASVDATNRIKIESPYTASCSSGPSTVAFLDGATSASSVELKGGGLSAIALGVVMTTSRSDAPDSFGGALHLQQPTWSGGDALSAGGTAVSEDSFGLATLQPITPRFGEDASTDDGLTVPASITTWPGQRVRIPVQCSGTGAAVAAWADWDQDGKFSPDERVTSSCDAAASVEWTVPDDVASGDLHIRARTASSANQVASPDGLATSGETESYTTGLTRPAPVTTNDRSTTGQNTPIDVDVLANDHPSAVAGTTFETGSLTVFDGSGKPVDVVEVDGGTVAVRDGELRFTPAAGFVGTIGPVRYGIQDSIKQTAQGTAEVVVTAVEPVAADDQVSTSQGRAVAADVLSNDAAGNPRTPLDPGSLRLQGASGLVEDLEVSGEGTYSIADGGIRFVPASSFSGTTSRVTYSIADVDGTRTTATLTVTVDPVTPVAAADTATVRQGGTVTTDVLANDVAGDEEVDLDRSTLSLNGAGEVEGVGTFEVVEGKIRFTGAKTFTGEASIDYTVRDANGTPATATLTVTVDPVTPVAAADTATVRQGGTVTTDVLANDVAG
ncbi:CshA/CshB family fibrillar adhesin-related protein, partial [Curtobacterium albidum]|uniref:CshA/CshB family fibrillar adhesin-related protein n=1 Tax=Curtobacterium citreum TaxID=2036 RepID=UPI0020262C98